MSLARSCIGALLKRGGYSVVQETHVCRNGHVRTDQHDPNAAAPVGRCHVCGEPLLGRCPHCEAPIPGKPMAAGVSLANWSLPVHCPQCGGAYPWNAQAPQPEITNGALARIGDVCKRFH